jgi:transcriptional regulator with XRE-family HTH domain
MQNHEMTTRIRQEARALLEQRGMNQNDLARELGVSRQYVSDLLTGRVRGGTGTWLRVAEVLGAELTLSPTVDFHPDAEHTRALARLTDDGG